MERFKLCNKIVIRRGVGIAGGHTHCISMCDRGETLALLVARKGGSRAWVLGDYYRPSQREGPTQGVAIWVRNGWPAHP
eukprot:scaffold7235_cov22-Tisochrysis_lutea.AAC.4